MPRMKRTPARGTRPANFVEIERLPVATLALRNGVLVAINTACTELLGWNENDLLERPAGDLIAELVDPRDREWLEQVSRNRAARSSHERKRVWCRVLSPNGAAHPVRVEWRRVEEEIFVFLENKPSNWVPRSKSYIDCVMRHSLMMILSRNSITELIW